MSMMKKTATSNLVMLVLDLDESLGGTFLFPSEKPKNNHSLCKRVPEFYTKLVKVSMLPDCTFIRSMSDEVVKHFRDNFLRNFILGNRDLVDFVFGKKNLT